MNKKEYDEMMGFTSKYISPKEMKLKKLCTLTGKEKSYWSKLKSKQLGGVLKANS